jgi:hypothetical protein
VYRTVTLIDISEALSQEESIEGVDSCISLNTKQYHLLCALQKTAGKKPAPMEIKRETGAGFLPAAPSSPNNQVIPYCKSLAITL